MLAVEPHVGERIREVRKAKGISQVDLAQKAGTSQVHLSRIETGENDDPHVSMIRKIAKALGVEPGDLI